jgi:hypothetical protein
MYSFFNFISQFQMISMLFFTNMRALEVYRSRVYPHARAVKASER